MKLTDQGLKINERVFEKLTRKEVSIDKMQFVFLPRCRTTNVIFILRQLQDKYLA